MIFYRLFHILILISIIGVSTHVLEAVEKSSGRPIIRVNDTVPSVYLDGRWFDLNHIRTEITFVNYVRDPERADIHIFKTDERVGRGGREFEISFIGQRSYQDINYTLKRTVSQNATYDEIRDEINEVLKIGLAPFMMRTPLASRFSLFYDIPDEDLLKEVSVDDSWNNWIFEIYAGRFQLGLESNRRDFSGRWGFFADRVTEDWKIRIRPYFNYFEVEIKREDDEPIYSKRHRHGFDTYVIMSLGNHWSAGLFGDYLTRNDQNLRNQFDVGSGIEYSLFPYPEATRKAVTFVYRLGYTYVDYYDETIFFKKQEGLLQQRLQASVRVFQPWGSIQGGLVGSHYFHDISHRRAELWGRVSVRIIDGLSLNFHADFEMINDQLSLPAGKASLEDVLLQQRQLATDFSVSGSISVSYIFGSDFANIVNTRF